MDAEDFLPVTGTYPSHPMSDVKPFNKTMTELTLNRKMIEKKDI